MDSYIIQLHPQDELTVVIDKIIHTQAGRIYLLIPDTSRIAQHALNFRLLKREADILGKEIVVVSASPRVQTLALKASLKAHQETHAFQEGARTSQDIFAQSPKLEDIVEPLIPEVTTPAPGRPKKPFFRRHYGRQRGLSDTVAVIPRARGPISKQPRL
jgi:hypothetical protein